MLVRRQKHSGQGQVSMEFTFSMIIVLLMFYGAVQVFRWAGLDIAERRRSHDKILTQPISEDWGCPASFPNGECMKPATPFTSGPISQIDPFFHQPLKMNATWKDF